MGYDLVLVGGTLHDGTGAPGRRADVAVVGNLIVAIEDIDPTSLAEAPGEVIDCTGLVVCPGFINPLSHSYGSILRDPRSLGELLQGVTTQVFGEGHSMGPWTEPMRLLRANGTPPFPIDITWSRLSEYLTMVEQRGAAQNVASFIGATTIREHVAGFTDRALTTTDLDVARNLIAEEMADGALGIASALIYAPGYYASTEELIELCRAAAPYQGVYISHMRSEGDRLLECLDELLLIGRDAEVTAEVYHLKAVGRSNWTKMALAIEAIDAARAAGQRVTANMYPYTAGGTGLGACIPPVFHDGGRPALLLRLADPAQRAAMRAAMEAPGDGWENLYLGCGGGDGILVLSTQQPALRGLQGQRLDAIARHRGQHELETLLDLVAQDPSMGAAYFMIDEDNLRLGLRQPWVSIGSDAASQVAEPPFTDLSTHPRSYGAFARVLGRYCRDEAVLDLADAIRRMTSLPAATLGLDRRGRVESGWFADLVAFDPATVIDTATYEAPHSYATGVRAVVVNGQVAVRGGSSTGTLGGRALKGPGSRDRTASIVSASSGPLSSR